MGEAFQFDGMTGHISEQSVEAFKEVFDSGTEVIHVSSVLVHEDADLTFKYVYAVKAFDYHDATGEEGQEGNWYVSLEFIVHPDSIGANLRKSIESSTDGYFEVTDILWHGGANITMLSEMVAEEELDHAIQAAMTCSTVVDAMRGFYLDMAWNRIGTTGWDTIQYAIGEKENLFF